MVVGGGIGGASVVWLGLDYTAAAAGLSLAGLTPDPETWAQLRQIEAGALEILNQRR